MSRYKKGKHRLIRNGEISPTLIKQLREIVMNDTREVKRFLGVFSGNIIRELPIRNRKFNLWVLQTDDGYPIGYISFDIKEENRIFIKCLYIAPIYRRKGYAETLFSELLRISPDVYCKINQGNELMYKLVKKMGLRGENPNVPSSIQPIWWSNYLPDSEYL